MTDDVPSSGIFGMKNIKRAAQELGIELEVDEILKGIVDEGIDLPSQLLKGGQELLETLLPFGN